MNDPETPYTLLISFTDGSSETNSYSTFERATWNFTEAIIRAHTIEARITTGGGAKEHARWRRP